MKKTTLALLLLVAILFLGGVDYVLSKPKLPEFKSAPAVTFDPEAAVPNLMQQILDSDPQKFGLTLSTRARTTQIFEKVDLSAIKNTIVFRNILTAEGKDPLTVYEIQGPVGQGSVTYLAVKLKFLEVKDSSTDINEVGTYGHNSFFYNDKNQPNSAFLVALVGDNLLGFEYNKAQPQTFEIIKSMIEKAVNLPPL